MLFKDLKVGELFEFGGDHYNREHIKLTEYEAKLLGSDDSILVHAFEGVFKIEKKSEEKKMKFKDLKDDESFKIINDPDSCTYTKFSAIYAVKEGFNHTEGNLRGIYAETEVMLLPSKEQEENLSLVMSSIKQSDKQLDVHSAHEARKEFAQELSKVLDAIHDGSATIKQLENFANDHDTVYSETKLAPFLIKLIEAIDVLSGMPNSDDAPIDAYDSYAMLEPLPYNADSPFVPLTKIKLKKK